MGAISTAKLGGENYNQIPDLIYNELGILWVDSAQKKTGQKFVQHQHGFNFSYKHKLYFGGVVGSHNNKAQKNFCTLHKIITNFSDDKFPKDIHKWFLCFSIRTKQTTVKPYFFKHVREYAKSSYWINLPKIEDPKTIKKTSIDKDIEFNMEEESASI